MQIKGMIVKSRIDLVKDNFGQDSWERVLKTLPTQDQQVLKGVVIAATWYPFEMGKRLDKAIVDVLGKGDKRFFEKLGVKSAQKSLTKEHKSFLVPGNPQAFMGRANMIYRYYYNTGHREYKETGPTSGVMTTFDAETFSEPDCLTVIGWYKEALKMCGAKDVTVVEEACRARGGTCCRYCFSWRM
jgi:uncharacterized protein (TIGR02265 family)